MGKLEFLNLGQGEVVRTTDEAALFRLESDGDEHWIPFSVLATPTAREAVDGAVVEYIRVEDWFADKNELEPVED